MAIIKNPLTILQGGSTPSRRVYTGHVDVAGLQALNWDYDDIAWLQKVVWWDEEDDEKWSVSQANITKGLQLTWANRNNYQYDSDVRYFPKLDTPPGTMQNGVLADWGFLVAVPTHGWDTSSWVWFISFFIRDYNLRSIGSLSDFNTSNLTRIDGLLQISKLREVDLSTWDVGKINKVTQFSMGCGAYSIGDLSQWRLNGTIDSDWAFGSIPLESFELKYFKPNSMMNCFYYCTKLKKLDLSTWDVSVVKDMSGAFIGCSSLASIDASSWDTSAVTSMYSMFYNCSSLASLDASSWDTSAVTSMSSMFFNCSSLASLDASSWDTSAVTNMYGMFYNCSSLASLDASSWDTSAVTNMYGMFYNCSSLASLDASSWDTSAVTSNGNMFYGCVTLHRIELGPNFFNSSLTSWWLWNSPWEPESCYKSLYTNQTLRDSTSPQKTISLKPFTYDGLTAEQKADIISKNFTLTK